MKICLLSARFPPDRCGVGDYTYFLACALAGVGHEVDVVTGVGELNESLNPLPSNVRPHRVVSAWGVTGLPELLKTIRRLRPHLLLIQYTPTAFDRRGISFAINLVPALTRAVSEIRVITNFHELFIPFGLSLKHDFGALWQRVAVALLAAGSQVLSVTAAEWQRRLEDMGIRKSTSLVPVGSNIPLAAVTPQEKVRLRDQLLGGSEGVLLAGFGARHDRDIPSILYGLHRLKRRGRAKLLWIGGGIPVRQHMARIELAIKENEVHREDIEWTGVLPHPEVSRLLSACDFIVLPFVDGISTRRTTAIAAMQHGLPVITTRGAFPEPLFIHDQNVYMLPAEDRVSLADGMIEMAERPEMRTRIAQGARCLYQACFTWDAIARQVSKLALETLRA